MELHHRAVRANPLEYGGSGVERQREIERDFKMLVAARDAGLFPEGKKNASKPGGKQKGTVEGSNMVPRDVVAPPEVPAWRQQMELDAATTDVATITASQWPPQERGEERRAATARMGPDGEPDPEIRGAPVQILVSGLDTLKVGKKSRKKGTPGKGKRKAKRSPSPATKTAGSSKATTTNVEREDDSAAGKEEAEVL